MADNNFLINLIASLDKAKSKSRINSDAKGLGEIYVKLIGKLDTAKTRAQIKNQVKSINNSMTITPKIDTKGMSQSIQQATSQIAKNPKNTTIPLEFDIKKDKLINDIKIVGQANTKLFKNSVMSQKYNSLLDNAKLAQSSKELSVVRSQLAAFKSELKATGSAGLTLGDALQKTLKRTSELFLSTGGVVLFTQQLRNAWKEALELDTALTNLARVNSEVSRGNFPEYLDSCFQKCKQLEVGVKGYIDSVTDFSRAGYDLTNSEMLADWSTMLSKVGDMSIENATSAILATVQAFDEIGGFMSDQLENKVSELVDKIDVLGNKASINQEDLAKAVQTVGSVMNYSNTSIDETLALISAGNRSMQDANKVALSLRTSALRLRAASSDPAAIKELEEMGESTDDLAVSVADLREEIIALTKVNGTGGVDILEKDGKTFKSIFEIYDELAKVKDKMTDLDFSNLLNLIAGKNRANAVSAMIGNMGEANQLLNESLSATGTATNEYEVYLSSAQAATERFGVVMTETYNKIINGETVADIANLSSELIEFANSSGILEGALRGVMTLGILKFFTTLGLAFHGTAIQLTNFGNALTGVQSLSTLTRGTTEYKATLDALKVSCLNLTDAQLKQILSNTALSESERIKILRYQGLSKDQAQARLSEMGLTQSTNAQTTANMSATASTFSFSSAIKGLGASIKAAFLSNPVGIAIMAISTAIGVATSAINNHNQKVEEARDRAKQLASEADMLSEGISELANKYISLSDSVKTDQGAKQDLIETQEELLKKLGLEGESIDGLVEKYGTLDGAIKQVTLDSLKEAEQDLLAGVTAAEEELVKVGKDFEKTFSVTSRNAIDGVGEEAVKMFETLADKGVIDRSTFGDKGGVFVLTGDESVEGIIENYDKLQEALKVLQGEYSATELKNNDFYNALYDRASEMKESVDSYKESVLNLNENLAEQQIISSLQGQELLKTKEEFEAFRDELVKTSQASGEFVGTQEDITSAINTYLSTLPQFEGYYTEPIEQALEQVNEIGQQISNISETSSIEDLTTKVTNFVSANKSLNEAISEQNSKGSISDDTLKSLTSTYDNLNTAVEMTTNGIRLNSREMGKLNAERKQAIRSELNRKEKELTEAFNKGSYELATYEEMLRNVTDSTSDDYVALSNLIEQKRADQEATLGQIGELQNLSLEYENAISKHNAFMDALSSTDQDAGYDEIVSGIKKVEEVIANGDWGKDEVREFINYMSYKDFSTASVDELKNAWDEAINSAHTYFTESIEGQENFLNLLKEHSLATVDSDDNWNINISNLDEAAKECGFSVDFLQDNLKKLEAKGFDGIFTNTSEIVDYSAEVQELDRQIEALENRLNHGDPTEGLAESLEKLRETRNEISVQLNQSEVANAIQEIQNLQAKINELNNSNTPGASIAIGEMQKQQKSLADKYNIDLDSTLNLSTDDAQSKWEVFKQTIEKDDIKKDIIVGANTNPFDTAINSIRNSTYTAKIGLQITSTGIVSKVKSVIQNAVNKSTESNSAGAYGTVNIGSAFADGNISTNKDLENVMVSEIQPEMVVNPKDGTYTIYKYPTLLNRLPRNSIVFNGKQTQEILENGMTTSFGHAYANGYNSTGKLSGGTSANANKNTTKKSTKNNNTKKTKDSKTEIDWIARKLERLQKVIDLTRAKFDNLFTVDAKSFNLDKQIKKTTELQKANEKAVSKYEKKAEKYAKSAKYTSGKNKGKKLLTDDLIKKIQNGQITGDVDKLIKEYGSESANAIQKYQGYWDKAQDAKQQAEELITKTRELRKEQYQLYVDEADANIDRLNALNEISDDYKKSNGYLDSQKQYIQQKYDYEKKIAELTEDTTKLDELEAERKKELMELEKQKFDNIADYYNNQVNLIQAAEDEISDQLSLLETKGMTVNKKFYETQVEYEKNKREELQRSKKELEAQLANIAEGTSAWYDAKDALNEVNSEIRACTKSISEMNNEIVVLADNLHSKIRDELSRISDTVDVVAQTWANYDMFDKETSAWTREGLATLGSYATAMNTAIARQKADTEVLVKMKTTLDKYSKDYKGVIYVDDRPYESYEALYNAIVQYTEYLNDDYSSALQAEGNLIDMIIQKYNAEAEALKKVIEHKKSSLSAERDLYNYTKQIRNQSQSISSLQKQIAAGAGDTSEEGRARTQKLRAELEKAQDELKDTETDRMLQVQQDMLDKLYDEYEALIDKEISDRDYLLNKAIDTVNAFHDDIKTTISDYSDKHNYYDTLQFLSRGVEAMRTTYQASGNDFVSAIRSLPNYNSLLEQVKTKLDSIISNTTPTTPAATNPASTPTTNSTPDTSSTSTTPVEDEHITENSLGKITTPLTNPLTNFLSNITPTKLESVVKAPSKSDVTNWIKKKAQKPDKKKSEYSDTNKKIWDLTSGKVLSSDNMKALAKYVGVTYDNAKSSGKLYKALKKIGVKGFDQGGIGKLVPAGEDGLAWVRNGEGFVRPEDVKHIQELLNVVPDVKDILKPVNIPNIQPVNNNSSIGDIQFNIEMNGVNDVETFSKQIREAYCSDERIVKMIQCDNIMQLKPNSTSYSRNRYKY